MLNIIDNEKVKFIDKYENHIKLRKEEIKLIMKIIIANNKDNDYIIRRFIRSKLNLKYLELFIDWNSTNREQHNCYSNYITVM